MVKYLLKMASSVIVTIFSYFLLLSTILFTVISGVGYNYFSNQLLFTHFKVNIELIFGFGIGVGIFLFFMTWTFLFYPNFICNWFFTFPMTTIFMIIYLLFTLPISQQGFINKTEEQWRNSLNEKIVKRIQYQYECCGWSNFTDCAINPCPISFDSNCLNVFKDYINPRFHEINISAIFMLITFVVSLLVLSIYARVMNSESLVENIFLLNSLFEE